MGIKIAYFVYFILIDIDLREVDIDKARTKKDFKYKIGKNRYQK